MVQWVPRRFGLESMASSIDSLSLSRTLLGSDLDKLFTRFRRPLRTLDTSDPLGLYSRMSAAMYSAPTTSDDLTGLIRPI